jgi:hypothetical protein
MNDISQRLVVHCPDRQGLQHLAAFISEHRLGDGRVRIALRLPVGIFGDRRALIERRVIATLYPLRSVADPHPTFSVSWSPEGSGPFPDFTGALAIDRSTDDDAFTLVVCGHYEPPHRASGSPLDISLGKRIALASARDLLRSIADYVEKACAHSEAARAGYYR